MDRLVCLTTTRYGTQGRSESRSHSLGLIKLDKKQTGAPSAGNLHAGCDAAGTGNGSTATPKRARRGKSSDTSQGEAYGAPRQSSTLAPGRNASKPTGGLEKS